MDRIDLVVHVSRVPNGSLLNTDSLKDIQHLTALKSIVTAMDVQKSRFKRSAYYNSSMTNRDLKKYAALSPEAKSLLLMVADRLKLSARGYFKIIKLARTITDLENKTDISPDHISEALQYRM